MAEGHEEAINDWDRAMPSRWSHRLSRERRRMILNRRAHRTTGQRDRSSPTTPGGSSRRAQDRAQRREHHLHRPVTDPPISPGDPPAPLLGCRPRIVAPAASSETR